MLFCWCFHCVFVPFYLVSDMYILYIPMTRVRYSYETCVSELKCTKTFVSIEKIGAEEF